MRVLLDENLPVDLARELSGHDVRTVAGLGWEGTTNGELLRRAVMLQKPETKAAPAQINLVQNFAEDLSRRFGTGKR